MGVASCVEPVLGSAAACPLAFNHLLVAFLSSQFSDKMFPAFGFGARIPPDFKVISAAPAFHTVGLSLVGLY